MKNDEFVHILTRVVNSRFGARFLEAVHELREILEEAGVAEEVEPRLEPGKPLRQRSPDDIAKKPKLNFPAPPPLPSIEAIEGMQVPPVKEPQVLQAPEEPPPAAEAPAGAAPATPADASVPIAVAEATTAAAVADAGPGVTDVAGAAPSLAEPGDRPPEFIEAGPGRLIRNIDAAPPPDEKPAGPSADKSADEPADKPSGKPRLRLKGPKKESVRTIVLSALGEGDKTMAELESIVQMVKGPVSQVYQQTYLALKKIGAAKTADGKFTLSTKEGAASIADEAPATEAGPKQLNLLDEVGVPTPPAETAGDENGQTAKERENLAEA